MSLPIAIRHFGHVRFFKGVPVGSSTIFQPDQVYRVVFSKFQSSSCIVSRVENPGGLWLVYVYNYCGLRTGLCHYRHIRFTA